MYSDTICAMIVLFCIKSYALFTQCFFFFLWQKNKQNIVVTSFARPKRVWFLHVGMLKDKVYSDNIHT